LEGHAASIGQGIFFQEANHSHHVVSIIGDEPLAPKQRSKWLLFFTLFQVMIGFGIIMPVIPQLTKNLGGGSIAMGLLVTVWAAGQVLMSAWWGALSDRIGRRPVLMIGLSGYVVAFVAMALSPNLLFLLASRLVGGLLSAATIPTAQAYAVDITPIEERGPIMATMGAAMNLGFICGPTVGALIAPFGERAPFWIAAALAAFNWILSYFLLPEPAHRAAATKERVARKLTYLQALRGKDSLMYILTFVITFGGSQMFSMIGIYLIDRFRYGTAETGIALTVEGLAAAVLQIFLVGPAIRRLGESGTIRAALIAGMIGFGCLILAPGLWMILIGLVLIAAAIDCMRPTIASMLSARTLHDQGVTMGMQTGFDALGRTAGPLWAGLIYGLEPRLPFALIIVVYIGVFVWTRTALLEQVASA
jgi:DHA1 family multidrug resistance protein-like MFS transporter